MPIAPRFTPSVGNVGSMPIPVGKRSADPTAALLNTLGDAAGRIGGAASKAISFSEQMAQKQDAYNTAAVSHQYNLWRAKREQARAELTPKPFDAKTIDEERFVVDDEADAFRAELNEDQLEKWDRLVEVDRIKDKTWLNLYKRKNLDEQSVKTLSVTIEDDLRRESEEVAVGQQSDYIKAKRDGDIAALGRITSEPPEVSAGKTKAADAAVKAMALDRLVAANASPKYISDFYNLNKGQFGDKEGYAAQRASAAVAEVAGQDLLKAAKVVLPNGNIDVAATERNILEKQLDNANGTNALHQLKRSLSIQDEELKTVRQNLNAMIIDHLSGDKYDPESTLKLAEANGLGRLPPDYQSEFRANARRTPEGIRRGINMAIEQARLDNRKLDILVKELADGKHIGSRQDMEHLETAVAEMVAQRDSAAGKMRSQVYNKVMDRFGGPPKIDSTTGAYEDEQEATRRHLFIQEVISVLPPDANEETIDKAIREIAARKDVKVYGVGEVSGALYERAEELADEIGISADALIEEARKSFPGLSSEKRIELYYTRSILRSEKEKEKKEKAMGAAKVMEKDRLRDQEISALGLE